MVDYVTIKQAIENLKAGKKNSSIIVKVLSLGELNTGNKKDGSQYKKMDCVVKDNSDSQTCTLWDGDIGRLEQGKVYKLESPYWSFYKEKPQLGLGQYCTVHLAAESDMLGQQTISTSTTQTTSSTDNSQHSEVPSMSANTPTVPIPKVDSGLQAFVKSKVTVLEQIRQEVEANLGMFGVPINGPHVGMLVSLIYKDWDELVKESWKKKDTTAT